MNDLNTSHDHSPGLNVAGNSNTVSRKENCSTFTIDTVNELHIYSETTMDKPKFHITDSQVIALILEAVKISDGKLLDEIKLSKDELLEILFGGKREVSKTVWNKLNRVLSNNMPEYNRYRKEHDAPPGVSFNMSGSGSHNVNYYACSGCDEAKKVDRCITEIADSDTSDSEKLSQILNFIHDLAKTPHPDNAPKT